MRYGGAACGDAGGTQETNSRRSHGCVPSSPTNIGTCTGDITSRDASHQQCCESPTFVLTVRGTKNPSTPATRTWCRKYHSAGCVVSTVVLRISYTYVYVPIYQTREGTKNPCEPRCINTERNEGKKTKNKNATHTEKPNEYDASFLFLRLKKWKASETEKRNE